MPDQPYLLAEKKIEEARRGKSQITVAFKEI
jgi:hypothetical protein